jgi:hypothetical protein
MTSKPAFTSSGTQAALSLDWEVKGTYDHLERAFGMVGNDPGEDVQDNVGSAC